MRALSFLIRFFKDLVVMDAATTRQPEIDPKDRSTQLAIERTDLAVHRNAMAAERTLMAWIRTALSMISFGFTIGKLGEVLASAKVTMAFGRESDVKHVAYFLVVLGTSSLIMAIVQNRIEVAGLVRMGLKRRPNLALFVAVLLSLIGLLAFTDLVGQF
jgi:putative membrane protein